ncbi:hypothetical protein [Sinomonas sp. G460-2]|uniref:hypothetical protein n=1 Tax=Sinomonas sp. G460-2 TaxID=3393464 RepID=UPI0039EE4D44
MTDETGYKKAQIDTLFSVRESTLNVLQFGVVRGRGSSQTAAIKAALDANPGRTFYFPPGEYRLDTSLIITKSNSLILDVDACIYAASHMGTLIEYTPDVPEGEYAQDKCLVGGTLDGNLCALNILSIGKVIRFTLTQVTFRDGVQRGLITRSGPGAELFAYDLRFYNTTAMNISNNVAIEANMGDSHFRDIVMRDWTAGVVDTASNSWTDVHPWIGPDLAEAAQMTSRFPKSFGFRLVGDSDLIRCFSDTMRTGFVIGSNGGSHTPRPRFLACRAQWSSATLPDDVACAHPYHAIDNTAAVGAYFDRLTVAGMSMVPGAALTGTTTGLNMRGTRTYGFIDGSLDYHEGIGQDTADFTPTVIGSTTDGSASYSFQSGRMITSGERVTYIFDLIATLDATVSGNLRLGGFPVPTGANTFRTGTGEIGFASGVAASTVVNWAGSSIAPVPMMRDESANTTEISVTALRGATIEIHGKLTVSAYRA